MLIQKILGDIKRYEEFQDTKGTEKKPVKSGKRQVYGQQNKTNEKYKTHNTTLKTKAGVTRTLQIPG